MLRWNIFWASWSFFGLTCCVYSIFGELSREFPRYVWVVGMTLFSILNLYYMVRAIRRYLAPSPG